MPWQGLSHAVKETSCTHDVAGVCGLMNRFQKVQVQLQQSACITVTDEVALSQGMQESIRD